MHIPPLMNVSELWKDVWKKQLKLSLFPHYTWLQDVTSIQSNSAVLHLLCVLSTFLTPTKSSVILPTAGQGIRVWDIRQCWWDKLRNLKLEQMKPICCPDIYSFMSSSCRNTIKNKLSSVWISDPLKSQQAGSHPERGILNSHRAFLKTKSEFPSQKRKYIFMFKFTCALWVLSIPDISSRN